MKKIISIILVVLMIVSMSFTTFASEDTNNSETFSFINKEGEVIMVEILQSKNTARSNVYVDGILTQSSVANRNNMTINTNVYDVSMERGTLSTEKDNSVVSSINGFTSTVSHMPVTDTTIESSYTPAATPSVYNEPVTNAGLIPSGYGDGYYFLGNYGGFIYAPTVMGGLFRTYTKTYDGVSKYWSWGAGETLSAISAAISLFGGPVSAIVGVLTFTGGLYLSYEQAIELATYTFDYHYRVRVEGEIYFTAQRNITYWEIVNLTEATITYEEKSFNYGFSMANTEMVKFGIDAYLDSTQ